MMCFTCRCCCSGWDIHGTSSKWGSLLWVLENICFWAECRGEWFVVAIFISDLIFKLVLEVRQLYILQMWNKRGHIVADTLVLMMFLRLRKLGNICCGHKMFLNKIRHTICVRNKCCARGQTGKHLCRQQCVPPICPRLPGPLEKP